jgi:predicted nucleic acid-binding protein
MSALHFVDTNLLVYRHDRDEPEKQAKAQRVMEALWRGRTGRVSTQVLGEFYVVVTRKLAVPVAVELARREVRQLHAWRPVPASPDLHERAWEVEDRFGFGWWDALIVAAARQARCDFLLTEDLQHGQDLGGVVVANPFASDLAELALDG